MESVIIKIKCNLLLFWKSQLKISQKRFAKAIYTQNGLEVENVEV